MDGASIEALVQTCAAVFDEINLDTRVPLSIQRQELRDQSLESRAGTAPRTPSCNFPTYRAPSTCTSSFEPVRLSSERAKLRKVRAPALWRMPLPTRSVREISRSRANGSKRLSASRPRRSAQSLAAPAAAV